ncbi:serum amyloid P-component-like isoform X2 [Pyxicephalus adspersus]|uniref:serum amyloid P-component-like isoform X2 n=1 Tax=Pyxicephalus adspersus TaxID=30357 RepID=UPI003B5C0DE2
MELSALVLLMVIPVSLAGEDLDGKMFIFSKKTNIDHVILKPTTTTPLERVSVCLHYHSQLSRPYSLFSMASSVANNALLIVIQPPNVCSIYINQVVTTILIDPGSLYWIPLCVTWGSDTGEIHVWVNETHYPGGVLLKGSSITSDTSIVLGQGQDTFGGGFDSSKSFVGEISDVNMWDYDLTPEHIQKVVSGDLHGNLINWKSLVYEVKGDVLVQEKLQNLDAEVLVFPRESSTDHVILKPILKKPLEKLSVCLISYTDLSRPYSLFSLATPGKDNAFLIYFWPPNTYSIFINQAVTHFKTDLETLDWRHLCVTWDSNTGVVQLWVNRKFYPRKVSMKGSSIAAETSIILGHDQDTFGGGFDASESFVGEISHVHMWDYVLAGGDIANVITGYLHGNVINWKSILHKMRGEVLAIK